MKIFKIHLISADQLEDIKLQARLEGRKEEMRITDIQIKHLVKQVYDLQHRSPK